MDSRPESLHSNHSLEIYALEKEGNRGFSIVELGKVEIGNLSYFVYLCSEQPLAREQITEPGGAPSSELVPAYSTVKS